SHSHRVVRRENHSCKLPELAVAYPDEVKPASRTSTPLGQFSGARSLRTMREASVGGGSLHACRIPRIGAAQPCACAHSYPPLSDDELNSHPGTPGWR